MTGSKYFAGGMVMAGGATAIVKMVNGKRGSDSGDNSEVINFQDIRPSLLCLYSILFDDRINCSAGMHTNGKGSDKDN